MAAVAMRDGSTVSDVRLGRLKSFDPQSRNFPLRALVAPSKPSVRGRSWTLKLLLDQLQTSACTGFSRTHDLAALPGALKKHNGQPFDYDFAFALYRLAQQLDEWEGENYEGSSILGAAKAAQKLGFIGEYRWAFGIDDALLGISHLGPLVVGTTWKNDMFSPRPSGLLEVSGSDEGGHAYMFRGVAVTKEGKRKWLGRGETIRNVPLLRGHNSWGYSYGINGEFFMWADDLDGLLKDDGEALVQTSAFRG